MKFTDLFVRRPVLATVVSLIIFLLGLRSIQELDLRQFPKIQSTDINISTSYPGASADLMQGFVTTPIQQAISSAEGIDYITSSSAQSVSQVTAHLKLNYDQNAAMTQIMAKVNEVRNQLPASAESPVVQLSERRGSALMYISFYSDEMNEQQVTDYLTRVVQPKLQTVEGVAEADILGAKTFAMRIWLDPARMASLNVTAEDVARALQQNNYLAAVGETKGHNVSLNIAAATDLHSVKGFGDIVIRKDGNTLVRVNDVANVELGAENYDSSVLFSGQKAVFIAINGAPDANPLNAVQGVRDVMPDIEQALPPTLHTKIVYDATQYISNSIDEVIRTIAEAGLIVILVIFLFLGALRAVAIPVITIPLSLVGACFMMLLLGYSLNILTLLAMVLAIGLVVDDAIVVVENTHRHIEEGMTPFKAALLGAREIATPVIAMTITLAAVYAPIGFMGGLTGSLFREFAFTLAGAVIISGIVALTLSPMMCSKFLAPAGSQARLANWLDERFEGLKERYQHLLHTVLSYRPAVVIVMVTLLLSCVALYMLSQKELAPTEDQSFIFVTATGPEEATHDYMTKYADQIGDIFAKVPEERAWFMINGLGAPNNIIAGINLKPWDQRTRSQAQIQPGIQAQLNQITGLRTYAVNFPSLPGSSGLPIQFVVSSTESFQQVYEVSSRLMQDAMKSGLFMFMDTDLRFNQPQLDMHIDRDKAAELGISMQDLGSSLSTLLGGGYVNRFNLEGRAYKVIPQVADQYRRTGSQLTDYYVRASNGSMVPLSTVVSLGSRIEPNKLNQFQQLNAATLQGMPSPGVTLGQALDWLRTRAQAEFPKGFFANYSGESRQYIQEGNVLLITLFFSILIIFLVLAAQFESFLDPLIILFSVPLAVFGALVPIMLGVATINIYTQVGLVTLVGLISKHGILMVDFANKLQRNEGLERREAIERAAAVRLRPILMTTAAMVLGVVPLLLASGAGAASRFDIGLVISSGMLVGTLFTLFVVPTMYTYLATRVHTAPQMDTDA